MLKNETNEEEFYKNRKDCKYRDNNRGLIHFGKKNKPPLCTTLYIPDNCITYKLRTL